MITYKYTLKGELTEEHISYLRKYSNHITIGNNIIEIDTDNLIEDILESISSIISFDREDVESESMD